MRIKEVMTGDVKVIRPDASLQQAAAIMKDLDVGPLPICEGDRLLGIVTDRDLTIRATAEGVDPTRMTVRQIMTPDVVAVFEDQDVDVAARLMQQHQVRRLLVTDRDGRLAGIVSLGDLAVTTGDDKLMGQTIQEISEPAEPAR